MFLYSPIILAHIKEYSNKNLSEMLNLIKKISLTNKLLTITKMLNIIQIQHLTKMLKGGC